MKYVKKLTGKMATNGVVDRLCYETSIRTIRIRQKNEDTPDSVVNTVFGRYSFGIYHLTPLQLPTELKEFLNYLHDKQPETVLEVGTSMGGMFYALCRALPTVENAVTIDLPKKTNESKAA